MAQRQRCFICNDLYPQRTMRLIRNYDLDKTQITLRFRRELNYPAAEINENSRVCINCDELVRRDIEALQKPNHLRLNVLKQKASNLCFLCNNINPNMQRLSTDARVKVYIDINIFIPESSRACSYHLNDMGFLPNHTYNELQSLNRSLVLSGMEVSRFFSKLREVAQKYQKTSLEPDSLPEADFKYLTTLTRAQFDDLYNNCNPVAEENCYRNITKDHLFVFLCKLRHNCSDEFLKTIFHFKSRQAVSTIISVVRRSIFEGFVPLNIGIHAITRPEYIERHVTPFSNALYNDVPQDPKAIVIADGTYSYIEKSGNYRALRQSYSVYKGRHLVKPVLMVAPNGYILDIHGPYFSDAKNNDASILINEFEQNRNEINEWFQEGDIFLVDHGYRDAVRFLEDKRYVVKMPPCLGPNQRQLSAELANLGRSITMQRWVVEARNGHIKRYRLLDGIIPRAHILHLKEFYLIVGALINKYSDRLLMLDKTVQLAQQIRDRINSVNIMQARVEVENLARRNAMWREINQADIPEFPQFDLDFLRGITLGVYQIELASSYIQDYLEHESTDIFQFDGNRFEPGLLRFRIFSRFRNATRYQLWISFVVGDEGMPAMEVEDNPILGYYCTCKSGARTLGCCAHVASVLWFLGWARHQQLIKYPSRALLDYIEDAGNRNLNNGRNEDGILEVEIH